MVLSLLCLNKEGLLKYLLIRSNVSYLKDGAAVDCVFTTAVEHSICNISHSHTNTFQHTLSTIVHLFFYQNPAVIHPCALHLSRPRRLSPTTLHQLAGPEYTRAAAPPTLSRPSHLPQKERAEINPGESCRQAQLESTTLHGPRLRPAGEL